MASRGVVTAAGVEALTSQIWLGRRAHYSFRLWGSRRRGHGAINAAKLAAKRRGRHVHRTHLDLGTGVDADKRVLITTRNPVDGWARTIPCRTAWVGGRLKIKSRLTGRYWNTLLGVRPIP